MSTAAENTGILVYRLVPKDGTSGKAGKIKHKSRYKWQLEFPPPAKGKKPRTLDFLRGHNFDFHEAHRKFVNRAVFRLHDRIVVDPNEQAMYLANKILGPCGELYFRASVKIAGLNKPHEEWVLLTEPSRPFPEKADELVEPPDHIRRLPGEKGDVIAVRPLAVDLAALRASEASRGAGEEDVDEDSDSDTDPGDVAQVDLSAYVNGFAYSRVTGSDITELTPYEYNWFICKTDGTSKPEHLKEEAANRFRKRLKSHKMEQFDRAYQRYEQAVDENLDKILSSARKELRKSKTKIKVPKKLRKRAKALLDQTVPSATPGSTAPQAQLGTVADAAGNNGVATWSNTLAAGPEALASGLALVTDIKRLADPSVEQNETPQLWVDVLDHSSKLAMSGAKLHELIAAMDAVANGAEHIATGASGAAGGLGLLTGILSTTRSSIKFRRSIRCNSKLSVVHFEMDDADLRHDDVPLSLMFDYAWGKTTRRSDQSYLTAIAGVIGTAGGAVAIALFAGAAANIWNPVGWALGIVGLAVGLSVVGMQLYKRQTKKSRRKRRIERGAPVSPEDFGRKLMAILQDENEDCDTRWFAYSILDCFGVKALWFQSEQQLIDYNADLDVGLGHPFNDLFESYTGDLADDDDDEEEDDDSEEDAKSGSGSDEDSDSGAEDDSDSEEDTNSDSEDSDSEEDSDIPASFLKPRRGQSPPTSGNAVIFDKRLNQYVWTARARRSARKKMKAAMT